MAHSDLASDTILAELAEACQLSPDCIEDVYSCSPLQIGIMAEYVKQKDNPYVYRLIYSLDPSISRDLFSESVRVVALRNAILRTRIVDSSNGFLQVVVKEEVQTESSQLKLDEYILEDREVYRGPGARLFRSTIVGNHWILTAHHAIIDQWAHTALAADIWSLYQQQEPPMHAPFKSFIKRIQDMDDNDARSLWASRFQNMPTIFPAVELGYTAHATTQLERVVRLEGSKIVGVHPALLPSYIEAAWALTAATYSDSRCVAFGLVLSGRNAVLAGAETTLGLTIVSVLIEVNLKPQDTVLDVIKQRTKERRQLHTYPALQYGLPNIRKVSEAAQAASGFQTLLNIRSSSEWDTKSSAFTILRDDEIAGPNCLNLTFNFRSSDLLIEAKFDVDVLDEGTMTLILRQFDHILLSLLEAPRDTRLEEILILNDHDLEQIHRWNQSVAELVRETVAVAFKARTAMHPDLMAVESAGHSLSFGALDTLSSSVARMLRRKGLSASTMVPFIFEKSVWTVVAILGILKSGASCVPIDPTHPEDRQKLITSSVNAKLIVSSEACSGQALRLSPDVVVVNAETTASVEEVDNDNSAATDSSDQPAYVLFTSGSTGSPKGVVLSHRNLLTAIDAITTKLSWIEGFRVLQFAAHVWDVSILEILGTLLAGACVCIPSEEAWEADLVGFINSSNVECILLTPTVLRTISPKDVPTVKAVVSLGEPVDLRVMSKWKGQVRLFNGWGPCEASILAAIAEIDLDAPHPDAIGTGIGCALWIVDPADTNRLRPIGVVGEVIIEGPGVAHGYLNDSAKTAASFISPPSWRISGKGLSTSYHHRFYRTGDLARFNSDGTLCFLGRHDDQVKIRGQRFELRDVEAVLSGIPNVKDSCVTVQITGDGHKVLIAILTFHNTQQKGDGVLCRLFDQDEVLNNIRDNVALNLPSFMVPTCWIALERIPKTSSMKVDRQVIKQWLNQLDLASTRLSGASRRVAKLSPPRSPLEIILQQAWASVLGLREEEIGRESSFFLLGGDSISAMQVTTWCRKKEVILNVATLLKTQVLAKIAAELSQQSEEMSPRRVNMMVNGRAEVEDEQKNLPLSPTQQLFVQNFGPAAHNHFNQAFLLELREFVQPNELQRALNALVAHHPMLRARFSWITQGQWTQYPAMMSPESYDFRVHSLATDIEMQAVIRSVEDSLDLREGPVFAVHLITFTAGCRRQIMFMSAHHLVINLVSWRTIWSDLESLLRERQSPLPESLSFASWLRHLQNTTTTNNLSQDTENSLSVFIRADQRFWNMKDVRNLTRDSKRMVFKLDATTTTAILGSCNLVFDTQPVELMLAAVLSSWSKVFIDRKIPALFCEGHGRNANNANIDISRTVGWFTVILPLLTLEDESVSEFASAVSFIKSRYRQMASDGNRVFASCMTGSNPLQRGDIEILFNFVGRMQAMDSDSDHLILFSETQDKIGLHYHAPESERTSLFDILATVKDSCLGFTFEYSFNMAHQNRIHAWISEVERRLKETATNFSNPPGREINPTKLPRATEPITHRSPEIDPSRLANTLLDALYPKLRDQVQKQDIESIAPATDIQAMMLAAGRSGGNGFHDDHNISIQGGLDVNRLKRVLVRLLKRHGSLRTIFIPHKTRLHQVVVRYESLAQRIFVDADQSEADCVREDLYLLPRFHLSTNKTSICTRLSIKIHHALYDMSALGNFLTEVAMAYDQQPLPQAPSFHDWISHTSAADVSAAKEFWRNYLWSTTMTDVAPTVPPKRVFPHESVMKFTVPRLKLKTRYGTPANVLKAAWSMVLSVVHDSSHIAFGQVSANRVSTLAGTEHIFGACLNLLPMKAHVDLNMTFGSLVAQLQDDFFTTLPFHHLGYRTIVQECTSWPKSTRCGSIILYQNHRAGKSRFQIGGQDCTLTIQARPGDFTDMWVVAFPQDDDIEIWLQFSKKRVPAQLAAKLRDALVSTLESVPYILELPMHHSRARILEDKGGILNNRKHAGQTVREAWEYFSLTISESNESLSMFDAGADYVTALLLAEYYRECRYQVDVKDLILYPSQLGQEHLLSLLRTREA